MAKNLVVRPNKINGTGRKDFLLGTSGADIINGRNADDSIFAGLGDDIVNGGNGSDTINGGGGSNVLTGGRGFDTFQIDGALEDSFDLITDFEGALPTKRAATKPTSDTLEILNAEGRTIVLVQTDEGTDVYINAVKFATLAGARAESVLASVRLDGEPASLEIGDVPGGENRAPEVDKALPVELTEDTAVQQGTLLDFVSDPDGDTLTFRLIEDRPEPVAVEGAIVPPPPSSRGVPGFTLNSDGSWTFDTNDEAWDYLNSGDTAFLGIAFEVSDGKGGVSQGRLNIVLNGDGEAPNVAPIVEDGIVLDETENNNFVFGSLGGYVIDPDSDNLTYRVVSGDVSRSVSATPPGFFLSEDGSWELNTDDSYYDYLDEGQFEEFVVEFEVDDNEGGVTRSSLTLRVNGADDNHDPVTQNLEFGLNAGDGFGFSAAANTSDQDGDTLTYSLTGKPFPGFTFEPNGAFTIDTSGEFFASIPPGETQDFSVEFLVDDGNGGTTTGTILFHVTGAELPNEAPTTEFPEFFGATEGTGSIETNISGYVFDPDSATLTFAVVSPVDGVQLFSDGTLQIDTDHAVFDILNTGETALVDLAISIDDGDGNIVNDTLHIRVNGVTDEVPNQAPVGATLSYYNQNQNSVLVLDIYDFISDPDNLDTELSFRFDAVGDGWTFDGDHTLSFNGGDANFGQTYVYQSFVNITVIDPGGLSDVLSIGAYNANYVSEYDT